MLVEQGDMSGSETTPSVQLPAGVTVISIHPMYSAGRVALATLLGGPLGGAWLMALNYRRLAEPAKARMAIAFGVLASAAVIAVGFLAGRSAVQWLLIVPVIAVYPLARLLQGIAYDRHVAAGGSCGSTWRAAGVGAVSLVVYLAAIFGSLTLHLVAITPSKVMIGRNSVFYADGVSRAEAEKVGKELVALEADPHEDTGWGVEVMRDGDRPVIAFIVLVRQTTLSDKQTQRNFHEYAEPLSRAVYGGAPVDIWLIDGMFRPRIKLSWESRPR